MFSVLQNSKCILPNMFSVNVYLEGNLIRMLLMHLHLTHQNVLLESFDVQETFWVFFISLFKPILLRNRKSPVTNHKRMQSPRRIWFRLRHWETTSSQPTLNSTEKIFPWTYWEYAVHKWGAVILFQNKILYEEASFRQLLGKTVPKAER